MENKKYTLFGDVFQKVDNGITINGKFFDLEKLEEIYKYYKNVNMIYRPAGILFYQAVYKHTIPMSEFRVLEEN